MATKEPGNLSRSEIDPIIILVNEIFDKMFQELNRKRLEIISHIETEFNQIESQRIAQINSIKELENAMKQLEESLHENIIQELRITTTEKIDQHLDKIKSEEIPFNLSFVASDIREFQHFLDDNYTVFKETDDCEETPQGNNTNINSLNSLKQHTIIDYSSKRKAKRVIGATGNGTGKLDGPMKLAFDKIEKHLYVPDANNRRIQVFNLEGEYVREFGSDILKFPCSVAIGASICFIADSRGRIIYKVTIPSFEFTAEQKYTPECERTELSYPVDIKFNSENACVYVADLENQRVCIFSTNLEFKSEFGKDCLKYPQYIQFYDNRIFVLDGGNEYFLHQFDRNANFELSIKKHGLEYQIINPKSFCFDPECGYIIVTDFDADTIKVLSFIRSNAFKIVQMIGNENPGSEVVDGCMGIVLVNGDIIVTCQKPQNCLKVI